jgi:hypothetical protein
MRTFTLLLLGAVLILCSAPADVDPQLPTLHSVASATLGPQFSCKGANYQTSALFLSGYTRQKNSPELLFNGSGGCTGPDFFMVNTVVGEASLIADLGDVALSTLNTQNVQIPFNVFNLAGKPFTFSSYTQFSWAVPIVAGHTYAVSVNNQDARGLYLFHVNSFTPDQQVKLDYEVLEYQVNLQVQRAQTAAAR